MKERIALCFLFVFLLLPCVIMRPCAIDDALTTARHARQVALGNGLLFSVGEQVLGTTTPLWTAVLVPLQWLPLGDGPGGDDARVLLQCLLTALCFFAALVLASRWLFPAGGWERLFFLGLGAIVPAIQQGACIGMETGAVCLAAVVLARALVPGDDRSPRWTKAAVASTALLLLRLDNVFLLGALAVAFLTLRPRRWSERWTELRPALRPFLVAAAVVGTWLVYCRLHYGYWVPHSMLAKGNLHLASALPRLADLPQLGNNAAGLLSLSYPWPRAVGGLFAPLYVAAVLLASAVAMIRPGPLAPTWLCVQRTFWLFFVGYAVFLTAGGAGIFPWYANLPGFLWMLAVPAALLLRRRERFAGAALALLMLMLGLRTGSGWGGMLTRPSVPPPERLVGLDLRERGCRSVLLEPIGYIGFYSHCDRMLDLAGLVSPELLKLRRGRWPYFYEAVKLTAPQYVVLRTGEVERNLGHNVGPLFASDEERGEFLRDYSAMLPKRPWGDAYSVYLRRTPSP